jgi:hypothetical protein
VAWVFIKKKESMAILIFVSAVLLIIVMIKHSMNNAVSVLEKEVKNELE